ncbi:MAG: hypothetical protein LBF97_03470 [Elusimicrobiota bacterium]|jgi:hypothetical protein|nr:hypothetical protein [Elusimicrobiota bacterium]
MTIEERIAKVRSEIEELGILNMNCDGLFNGEQFSRVPIDLEMIENAIAIIKEENKKHPDDWLSKYNDFILKVREKVFEYPKEEYEKYFKESQEYFWQCREKNCSCDEALKLTLIEFNPNKYWKNK